MNDPRRAEVLAAIDADGYQVGLRDLMNGLVAVAREMVADGTIGYTVVHSGDTVTEYVRRHLPPTVYVPTVCPHGYDAVDIALMDSDGRTACCGAYTSIHMDDGVEYCKCCYAAVGAGETTERTTITL